MIVSELETNNKYLIDIGKGRQDIGTYLGFEGGQYCFLLIFKDKSSLVYKLWEREVNKWVFPLPETEETRTVSSTGGEKGVKLARFDLIPPRAHRLLAEHYGRGASKYADNNWRKGYEWSKSIAALERHLNAFKDNEDFDEEMESLHLVAVAWHAFTLIEAYYDHPDFDDRWKGIEKVENDK